MDHISVRSEDFVIAADGGYEYCRSVYLEPDLILGDFDSLNSGFRKELLASPEKIRTLPREKDDTDTLAAIREGLAKGYREFEIYGSQGGRLSHTIANIQSLLFLKENGASGCLVEKGSRVFLIKEESVTFPENWQGYLSLFSLNERAEGVTIRNLKYELEGADLTNGFPVGVSNEFIGRQGSVSVDKGVLLAIAEFSGGHNGFCVETCAGNADRTEAN